MLQELIISFRDNLRARVTNPFLSTYILVWVIRNWELVYTFFYFDEDCTLNERIQIIRGFKIFENIFGGVWTNIWISLLIIIIGYSLVNASRLIVEFFEKWLKPQILGLFDKNAIVERSIFEKINLRLKSEESKNDELVESNRVLKDEIDKLLKEIQSLKNPIKVSEEDKDEMDLINKKVKELKRKNLEKYFKDIYIKIKNQNNFEEAGELDQLVKMNLLEKGFENFPNYSVYYNTELGEKVYESISKSKEVK